MKKKSKKKIVIGLSIAVIMIAGAALVLSRLSGGSAIALSEVPAVRQNLVTYYSFTGNVQSHDVQYVQAISTEPVKRFYVKEGDAVQMGTLLYEVDSNTIQSTLTQARTNLSNANTELETAQLNYERVQTLFDMGGVSQQELESARKSYTSAENQVTQATANMQQAQNQYDDTRRYAEISGQISKIYVKENQSVSMGTSIMDIVDYDNLEVEIKIDEYDLSSITVGASAEVQIEALGKEITGEISEIAREASVESGVSYFTATVKLPIDRDIRIGLTAEIKIITQSAENVVAVPVGAVSYELAGAFVQVPTQSGTPELRPVTVGINDGRYIEIKEGLSEGEIVLVGASEQSGLQQQMMMGPGGAGAAPAGGGAVPRNGGGPVGGGSGGSGGSGGGSGGF